MNNYANKIKRWYSKYTVHNNFVETKYNWVKFYRKFYESKYLLTYPEFMARKLNRQDLKDWINNNLPTNRNRYDVVKFLQLNTITIEDIQKLTRFPMEIGSYQKKPIVIKKGPYGFYLNWNSQNISLKDVTEDTINTISKSKAIELLK